MVCGSIIIPSTVELLKVKVSQQFTFSGALAVPSLSQRTSRGVESKSIPTVHFFLVLQVSGHYPSTSRIVESKSIPTVCFFFGAALLYHHYPKYK
jgi:hypothetical protein